MEEANKPIAGGRPTAAASSDDASVFVRGLPFDTTDEILGDYFGEVGPVLGAIIVRDKVSTAGKLLHAYHVPSTLYSYPLPSTLYPLPSDVPKIAALTMGPTLPLALTHP